MNKNKRTDIAIYVALNEEFQYILKSFDCDFNPVELEDIAITYFEGSVFSEELGSDVEIALIPSGRMGNSRSSTIMSAMLNILKPQNIVVLGIAGSLDNDLNPGDVLIPDSIIEYFANSAAVEDKGKDKSIEDKEDKSSNDKWRLDLSGNSFISSPRLINRFQNFRYTKPVFYSNFLTMQANNKGQLITNEIIKKLQENEVEIDLEGKLFTGDDKILASGPTVGKDKSFVKWLKSKNRKITAIEMESAGVYEAVLARTYPLRVMALRGISDFADERKEKIEGSAKTVFRILAIKNCVSLLTCAIKGGLFEEEKKTIIQR